MNLKALGLAAVAAMALTAFAASSASATTLEEGGTTKNAAVTIEASLQTGTKSVWGRTDGSLANECSLATMKGKTVSSFTGTSVTSPIAKADLTFTSCTRPVETDEGGVLHVAHTDPGTNGTVSSSGTFVTVGSPFGTLPCKTGGGVDIGTLTGTASGHAQVDISAVMSCGFLSPSITWKGTYTVTSPTGLGVSA